jgi:hypothetical protein
MRCNPTAATARTGIAAAQGAVQSTICVQCLLSQSGQLAQCDGVVEKVALDGAPVATEANAGRPVATAARQARIAESRRRRFMEST